MKDATDLELLSTLAPALSERVRLANSGVVRRSGEFVLFRMRTGARRHENPALDTALSAARSLRLPVFVYHGLSQRYPYASDRHHRFILEGARDVAPELKARGIGYAFHLERAAARGPVLKQFSWRAALVVTEDHPVPPLSLWTPALAAAIPAPVWCVDTACVVPMRLVPRRAERAFEFRDAYAKERSERVRLTRSDQPALDGPFVPRDLPFEPIPLVNADLDELVAACDVDHQVGPIHDTHGGSRAGYERWQAFKVRALELYHLERDNPLLDGTSRMSPYLHRGHVSPFRVAREASPFGGEGAAKFLDELLIWRELACAFCAHTPNVDSVSALPSWARESLEPHAADPRSALPSWKTLARAGTGDRLRDLCQDGLRVHGQLHNNLRMTWGKAAPRLDPGPGRGPPRDV
jgi:deoxyribodipyrimidine photolyase